MKHALEGLADANSLGQPRLQLFGPTCMFQKTETYSYTVPYMSLGFCHPLSKIVSHQNFVAQNSF